MHLCSVVQRDSVSSPGPHLQLQLTGRAWDGGPNKCSGTVCLAPWPHLQLQLARRGGVGVPSAAGQCVKPVATPAASGVWWGGVGVPSAALCAGRPGPPRANCIMRSAAPPPPQPRPTSRPRARPPKVRGGDPPPPLHCSLSLVYPLREGKGKECASDVLAATCNGYM